MIIYDVTFILNTGTKINRKIADHEVNWDGYPNTSPGIAMISTLEDLLLAEGIDVRDAQGFVWDQEMNTDDPQPVARLVPPANPIVDALRAKEKEYYYNGEHAMELASINPDSAESLETQAHMYYSFGSELGNIANKFLPLGSATRQHDLGEIQVHFNSTSDSAQEVARKIAEIINDGYKNLGGRDND